MFLLMLCGDLGNLLKRYTAWSRAYNEQNVKNMESLESEEFLTLLIHSSSSSVM
jgi:hypothetical protein